MLPSRFDYHRASSVDEALSLLDAVRRGRESPGGRPEPDPFDEAAVRRAGPPPIDINRISGLDSIEERDGYLAIGALVRHHQLASSETIAKGYPTLAAAAPQIADPIVRNLGTTGGSLAHADPAGDLGSVMLSMGASVVLRSSAGERVVPIGEFLVDTFTTSITPNELLTEIRVPTPPPRSGGTYLKLERKVGDFATVAVAVTLSLEDGAVGGAGIALTGVGLKNIEAARGRGIASRRGSDGRGFRGGGTPGRRGIEPRERRPGHRYLQATHGRGLHASRSRHRVRDGRGLREAMAWRSRSR